MVQTFIKQKVENSEDLKQAFQRLLRNEVDLIWAEDMKCSPQEFNNFNNVMNQIKNMSWMFNITTKLERTGSRMFLEIKKKKGNVMSKYERVDKLESYSNITKLEEHYDIDDILPEFICVGNVLHKLKKEEEKKG